MAETGPTVSVQEILKKTGVKLRTFKHFRDIGLLPRAVRQESVGGKGFIYYYPASVIPRLKKIIKWRKEGLGIEALRKALVADEEIK